MVTFYSYLLKYLYSRPLVSEVVPRGPPLKKKQKHVCAEGEFRAALQMLDSFFPFATQLPLKTCCLSTKFKFLLYDLNLAH
jgi:hypothetical protein